MYVREQVITDSFSGTLSVSEAAAMHRALTLPGTRKTAVLHGTDLSGEPGSAPYISTSKLLHPSKEGLQPSAVLGWANSDTKIPK